MFRRREDGTEEMMPESGESATVIAPSGSAPAPAMPSAPSAPAPSFRPSAPSAAMAARPSAPAPAAPAPAAMSSEPSRPSTAAARQSSKRVLTVGPEIQMKGEVASCDRVVIEGMVDATMRDVHTVELTETGVLKGVAEVEDAEISGTFEGDLTVRGKLTIHASGRIRGNVTYGEIEIQRGGQISGNVRNIADAKAAGNAPKAKVA